MSWVNTVPRVVNGETTFSESGMNPIIDALTTRTDDLYNTIKGLNGNQGYIMPDEGFTQSCQKGTIIAQNPETGVYEPASAEWSGNVRADGSWIPSYKSNVIGILSSDVSSDNTAIILCSGWSTDAELLEALAPDRVVGAYYLTTDGKATPGNSISREMRVYCYSYLGSGKLYINPGKPEYSGHAHNHVTITTNWVPASNATTSLPSTAKMVTDTSEAPALLAMIQANPQHPCLVKNGQEVMEDDWGIEGNYIYVNFVPLEDDVISLHAITPLTGDEPIVHNVQTTPDNKLITVESVGGRVWLGINTADVDGSHYSGTGVTHIGADGLKTGPVIQGIKAGAGIDVISYSDRGANVPGVVEISSTQYKNTLTDMSLCNLNQVLIGTSFNGVGYVFPGGTTSSLIGTIRIPHFVTEEQEGELVLLFQGNGAAISGLSAQVLIQPMPDVGASVGIPTSVTYTVPSISGASPSECYCQAIQLGGEKGQRLYSDGLIVCRLEASGGSDIVMVSMSFRLK